MLFSEAKGHKVVSTSTAETVGKVHGFLVDPASRTVVGLELKKTDHGDTLMWPDLTAFGVDAVTMADADRITEPGERAAALSGKDHHLVGKRLLATTGDELGKVSDVEFDPATGTITGILHGETTLPGTALVGVGSYAVVVSVT